MSDLDKYRDDLAKALLRCSPPKDTIVAAWYRTYADALLDSDVLARMVAEAKAEALQEAADSWPREINLEQLRRESETPMREPVTEYTPADWLRDRAEGTARGGDA